jgi:D-alanyl-D-alanine carboxypeptidase
MQDSDPQRIHLELERLGIPMRWIIEHALPFHPEAAELIVAETDERGRDYLLTPAAAKAWKEMKEAAAGDGITMEIVSSFRTIERQIEIIENKIARNMPMDRILTLSAPPGYSEHHSGRAIDVNTPGCIPTEEEFADTEAYRWLDQHAARFGFSLSYPRDNALGFIYEPWHWCHQG